MHGGDGRTPPRTPIAAAADEQFHLVFSNKTENDDHVLAIREELMRAGLKVWQQQRNIPKDSPNWFEDWYKAASKAIKIPCFLTVAYLKSETCMMEFKSANSARKKRKLLAIAIDPVEKLLAVDPSEFPHASPALAFLEGGGQVIMDWKHNTVAEILKLIMPEEGTPPEIRPLIRGGGGARAGPAPIAKSAPAAPPGCASMCAAACCGLPPGAELERTRSLRDKLAERPTREKACCSCTCGSGAIAGLIALVTLLSGKDACSSNPCLNVGTCTAINTVEADLYECACLPGYQGDNCEVNVDECQSSPCNNGATCMDGIASYTCTCTPGWVGDNCNFDVNECSSAPCQNGGACTDGVDSYQCTCPVGWIGPTCGVSIDECSSRPCQNGGVCVDAVNGYTCACAPGWTADNCIYNINDCSPNHCQNGGACTDGVNAYSCECIAGWTGTTCGADINECAPEPCANGVCIEGFSTFTCQCSDGWAGALCDGEVDPCADSENDCDAALASCQHTGPGTRMCTCFHGYETSDSGVTCADVDECSSVPCTNGATCSHAVDSYYCACAQGWRGEHCETDVDDCSPNPCLNGGACTDGVNAYSCSCAAGYSGDNCDVNVTPAPDCDGTLDAGYCYTTVERNIWHEAETECVSRGGHLASIHSAAQAELVAGICNSVVDPTPDNRYCWIGFSDEQSEGTWVWTDGSASDYTDWGSGEPGNYRGNTAEGEQCGVIVTRGVTSFGYHTAEFLDTSCVNTWDTFFGVCQVTAPSALSGCAVGTPFSDDFDSYDAGVLSGQGGWEPCECTSGLCSSSSACDGQNWLYSLLVVGASAQGAGLCVNGLDLSSCDTDWASIARPVPEGIFGPGCSDRTVTFAFTLYAAANSHNAGAYLGWPGIVHTGNTQVYPYGVGWDFSTIADCFRFDIRGLASDDGAVTSEVCGAASQQTPLPVAIVFQGEQVWGQYTVDGVTSVTASYTVPASRIQQITAMAVGADCRQPHRYVGVQVDNIALTVEH